MVYARKIGGKTLTFLVSGKLWHDSLIMQDEETGSLWSHVTGEALDGPMAGRRLQEIPSVQTTWGAWVAAHPGTLVLRKEKAVKGSAYESYFKDPDRAGIYRTPWLKKRFKAKTLVLGLTSGPHALAVVDSALSKGRFLSLKVGEKPIVLYRAIDGGVRAYDARAGGKALSFKALKGKPGRAEDQDGSLWTLQTARCIAGKRKGLRLQAVPVRRAFWFAWSSFYPNTAVVE